MERRDKAPEYSAPPPEYPKPGWEHSPAPESEYAALPPEYGQRTAPRPEEQKDRRRILRSLVIIPLLALLGFLTFRTGKAAPGPDGPAETGAPEPPAQTETAAPTLPVETAEPIPDLPEGSVVLDVQYAVRDGSLVRYKYDVYTDRSGPDADGEQTDEGPIWPVSVYSQVSDGENRAVRPETDPDVWEDDRYTGEEYRINAAGLEGDLTLTLRAVYTEQGEERQTVAVLPLAQLPPEPETRAELIPLGGGQVAFTAWLKPQSGDGSDFDLQTWYSGQICYYEGEGMHFSLMDDPRSVPVEYDPEEGFTVRYTGGSFLNGMPDGAELSIYVGLRDKNTGYIYTIESNRVTRPPEPRISAELELFRGGWAEFTAEIKIPEGDDQIYDLSVRELNLVCFEPGEDEGVYPLGEPGDVALTGSAGEGFRVHYLGPYPASSLTGNPICCAQLALTDNNTGKTYEAESNSVYLSEAQNALPVFPQGGKIAITVYNDTTVYDVPSPVDAGGWLTVLDVNTFPAEEFTEYALPEPIIPEGYDFLGWVVHVNNPFDLNSDEDLFGIYEGYPPVDILTTPDRYAFPVESTLTLEDVSHVPPGEDGTRYVNVHAVWVRREPDRELLYLDDGMGNVTAYGMDVPLASEGYIYLCRYPEPEGRDGWLFNGWYDSEGNRVDLLVCYFSFTPMLYNEDGDFTGYDWNATQSVYLTPGWKLDPEDYQ